MVKDDQTRVSLPPTGGNEYTVISKPNAVLRVEARPRTAEERKAFDIGTLLAGALPAPCKEP